MKTHARFLVITALAALLSGCLGSGGEPDFGSRAQALGSVDAEALPADLMSCNEFYGEDWDTPDLLLRVKNRSDVLVLVQDGEMVCSGTTGEFAIHIPSLDLGDLVPFGGDNDALGQGEGTGVGGESAESPPVGDSNPLPATPVGSDSAKSPVGDSNPLPAAPPVGGESAASPVDDSNPLPAAPSGTGSASTSGPVDDSNPLPARGPGHRDIHDPLSEY